MSKSADLSKYRRPGQQPDVAPAAAKDAPVFKRPYEPYRLSKDTKRHLEIRVKFPDPAECPLNSMITNIRGEWRRGLGVTLIYGKTMMIDIKGKNLRELIQALKEWKVDWIEEYDPRFHLPPGDEDAPLIKGIEIVTPKTEEPPPMNQRH